MKIRFEYRMREPMEPFDPQPLVAIHVWFGRFNLTYYPRKWLGNLLREKEYGKGRW